MKKLYRGIVAIGIVELIAFVGVASYGWYINSKADETNDQIRLIERKINRLQATIKTLDEKQKQLESEQAVLEKEQAELLNLQEKSEIRLKNANQRIESQAKEIEKLEARRQPTVEQVKIENVGDELDSGVRVVEMEIPEPNQIKLPPSQKILRK